MTDAVANLEQRIASLRSEQGALQSSKCERWWTLQAEIEQLDSEARFEAGHQREAGCE